jgi:hypothetical protein
MEFLTSIVMEATVFLRSRASPACVVIKLWVGQFGARMPAEAKYLTLLQNVQTAPGTHPLS